MATVKSFVRTGEERDGGEPEMCVHETRCMIGILLLFLISKTMDQD